MSILVDNVVNQYKFTLKFYHGGTRLGKRKVHIARTLI